MKFNRSSFHLIATGDILIHDACIQAALDKQSGAYDFLPMFSPVKHLIEQGDMAVCNLETTISGKEHGFSGYPRFNAPESLLNALRSTGFTTVVTANNHSVDFGEPGIVATIQALRRNGLMYAGTSDREDPAARNLLFRKNGITLGINAYTYGTNENPVPKERPWLINMIDFDLIAHDINYMRQNGADLTVICLHAGEEYLSFPDKFQIFCVNKLRSLGADIILGNHSHVIQPALLNPQQNSYVIFSLGNFLSNQRDDLRDAGIIVDIEIIKNDDSTIISGITYHPTYVHRWEESGKMYFRIIPLEDLEKLAGSLPDFPMQKARYLYYHIKSHIYSSVQF